MKDLAIILLNYNNSNDTLECVDSIKKNCSLNYELIVVDNKSTDDSARILSENKEHFYLILSEENSGFANGNNLGIQYALSKGIEYVLLLNNDTLIEKDSIEKMYEFIKNNNNVGIVSPRIMYYPDKSKIWFDGGKIDWTKYTVDHINMGVNIESQEVKACKNIQEVDFITGCCMLIKSEVLKKVGLLPDEYFMYYEDVDFCVKVINAGYKLIALREPKIYHKVSSSSGGEDSPFSIRWCTRNRLIFIDKYKNIGKNNLLTYSFFYSTRLIKFTQYIISGDKLRFNALKEGIKEGRKYIKEGK